MKRNNRMISLFLATILLMAVVNFTGCSDKKERVVIYTSAEDYRVEYMRTRLNEEFPDYKIEIEYISTGNQAAKLLAEGKNTDCDITHDLEYGYLEQLAHEDILADLSSYDFSIYTDDAVEGIVNKQYLPEIKNGGAVIVNPKILSEKGLPVPKSYEDLLKPEYKGLISMPNPKSSGTGYMFLKALVNSWGEEKAFEYFDKFAENISAGGFTSSGSGAVNALVINEAAIGLGMTSQAVTQINNGIELEVVFFDEGSPFSMYGQSMICGKETRECVKEVFDFLVNTFNYENNEKFFPDQIYKDKIYKIENYPSDVKYSDMKENTVEEKAKLLEKWKY